MSNKKNLLNEATIRRFMSLANMQPLSENFLDNVDESDDETVEEGTESEETVEEGTESEETVEESTDAEETVEEGTETEETVEEEIDLTLEEEEEEIPMDMGAEEAPMDPMDDMPAEEGTEVTLTGDQVASVRAALEDALALVGELGGEEAPVEDELGDEPMDDLAPEADADEAMEEDAAIAEFLDDDAVVQEVFKRVVSRIAKKD